MRIKEILETAEVAMKVAEDSDLTDTARIVSALRGVSLHLRALVADKGAQRAQLLVQNVRGDLATYCKADVAVFPMPEGVLVVIEKYGDKYCGYSEVWRLLLSYIEAGWQVEVRIRLNGSFVECLEGCFNDCSVDFIKICFRCGRRVN